MADRTPALRLDAHELDQEIQNLTKLQFTSLFKYFQTGFLAQYDPEITALLRLLLWKFTLSSSDQTVGQRLLGIRYAQRKTGGVDSGPWISPRQKVIFAILYIACPWFQQRVSTILKTLRLQSWEMEVEPCLRWTEAVVKVGALINFLVFLRQGVYLSMLERLVGMSAQFPRRQSIRQVSFDYMTRELLWHGFSELLLFLLPLISIQRIKNTALRWFAPRTLSSHASHRLHSRADLMACVVCGDWPIHPHSISCHHVFCYFCIVSNLKADPGYTCPVCGTGDTTGTGIVSPQPVRPTVDAE
ncbi:peroxisome biogenesis factor 2-like isoform X2 [Babylonia areolata]|uniref:peroxisome biogenesis factor 2-like isoform X2 n=1 Tax=Babylonia areolata TaxID=304850 RepID=UPI003FD252F7